VWVVCRMKLRGNIGTARLMQMLVEALNKEHRTWRQYVYKVPTTQGVEISPEDRNEIVCWLSSLTEKFHFYPDTFMLSVAILDRFLHTVKARPKYLRCIGITCFYLAAKMHEEDEVIPRTSELVKDSNCGCSVAEVLRMERIILDKLEWDVSAVTALDFLHMFHSFLMFGNPHLLDQLHHMTPSVQLQLLTSKLRSCLENHHLAAFRASTVAVALLSMELELFSEDWLPLTISMQSYAQVSNQELIHCREVVSRHLATHSSMRKNRVYMYMPTSATKLDKTSGKMGKRKVDVIEDDDVYSCIKRLYIEDVSEVMMMSCGSEIRSAADNDSPPPLQPVTAN